MTPLLAALPADGSPIVADLAVERSGLTPGVAWPLLVALCGEGRAKAWRHEGVTWVRLVTPNDRRPGLQPEAPRRTERMRQASSASARVNPSGVA